MARQGDWIYMTKAIIFEAPMLYIYIGEAYYSDPPHFGMVLIFCYCCVASSVLFSHKEL
jgi:hypothetical protein